MGYTHYWGGDKKPIDQVKWVKAIALCHKIIRQSDVELDRQSTPEVIHINGFHEDSCETFYVPIAYDEIIKVNFEFCKTRALPYDVIVTACLSVLAEAGLVVSTDGYGEDWDKGVEVASKTAGRPIKNPIHELKSQVIWY